ncbi:arsenate respiratory reductase molybdopterin-containing subunit ArrA [Ferrimonas marina]|uniref:Anaerobic selenocysteine-containing dehydrogenase n=1 Tax=Ferrimonas marina TaxID=299255 RepID=A0A1M5RMQ6_9GAMM|nr:arsenate respiratory reductase molybdopterin-containing subunit ArrA [Ferrimonas marina]SHH27460.1 Anaerobic selenocysteine-containing dehydrogenase [Ferrimonas marina]
MDIQRRRILKGTLAGAALSGIKGSLLFTPTFQAMAEDLPRIDLRTGTGEWIATTCQGCTSWCAKQVYVMDGRAIKVRGNPHSKVHGIASCPRQHLNLQQLYDTDRVVEPMIRTNPNKGRDQDPQFKPISWDQALDLLADKIIALRQRNESHKYALFRGRYSFTNDLFYDKFTKLVGSPNNISHSAICAEAHKMGPYYMDGNWGYNQYDLNHAKYVLAFGADPIASNRQTSFYASEWGNALDRATVVVVDPRLTASAAKAHKWIPIEPGKDPALALAIAHVALVEGLWYKPFVGDFKDSQNRFVAGQVVDAKHFADKHSHGLVHWWNEALKDYTPEWAQQHAGLDPEEIRAIARGMGKSAPAVQVWTSRGPTMQIQGTYTSLACHALNGLFGGIDSKGGLFPAQSAPLNSKFPSLDGYLDDVAKAGLKQEKIDQRGRLTFPALKSGKSGGGVVTNNVANAMLAQDPYQLELIIAYFSNFAFSGPDTARWEKALAQTDFVAHVTTNIAEFSWFADLLLPASHHMFEKWGGANAIGNGYRQVSIQQPVVKPGWNTKQDESELPYLLAKRLAQKGFDAPWRYINEQIRDPETGKAAKDEQQFAEITVKYVTAPLWDGTNHGKGERLNGWQDFVSKGVWNSNPYEYQSRWGKYKTVTGKFEFYSETLKKALVGHAQKHGVSVDQVLEACDYDARGELAFMPHYEEPKRDGDKAKYPLLLVDQKSRLNLEGRSQNSSWYYELKDVDPGDEANEDVAKFNPVDAKKLNLANGDRIRISSPAGSITCTAKLWEGVRPGTVAKCFGQGHWAFGRHASTEFGKVARGGNNNEIITDQYDRLSGSSAFYSHTRIRVEKA